MYPAVVLYWLEMSVGKKTSKGSLEVVVYVTPQAKRYKVLYPLC